MPPKKKTKAKTHVRSATDADVELGRRLRLVRLKRGMSQEQLAKTLGVSFQQVQKYEKGTNRVGSGRLADIARELDTTPHELMGWDSKLSLDTPIDGVTVGLVSEFEELNAAIKTPLKHLIAAIINCQTGDR